MQADSCVLIEESSFISTRHYNRVRSIVVVITEFRKAKMNILENENVCFVRSFFRSCESCLFISFSLIADI